MLGSGGVARDYLTLTHAALRIANERDTNASRPHNPIGAEDVNEAAADMSAKKQDDLRRDASTDAERLRERLADIVKFCLDVNGTNVLLVEGPALQEADWGKDVQALADLRLLHEFGNLSDKRGTYRGRRFVGLTLDLSNYTGTRSEQIRPIEFWTREGKQAARNANLIYTPGASEQAPKKKLDNKQAAAVSPVPDREESQQAALEGFDWDGANALNPSQSDDIGQAAA